MLSPPIRVALVVADLPAHTLREYFGAAAGHRIQPGVHQRAQHLLVGATIQIGEERDFDRRETLEMHVRPDALEASQELDVILERQVRVQTVDHVHFGERLMAALAHLVPGLFEAHRVGAGIPRLQPREGAEQAVGHANVRGLEAQVVVVVGVARVTLLALAIGEPANGQQVRTLKETNPIVEGEADIGVELVGEVKKAVSRKASAHRAERVGRQPPVDAPRSGDAPGLDAQGARARAVELGHQDPLPLA